MKTPPPPCPFPKLAKLGFWSQEMHNVLKRMQNQFPDFFTFFRSTKFSLRDFLTKSVNEKKIAQILMNIFSDGSEDSKEKCKKYILSKEKLENFLSNVFP